MAAVLMLSSLSWLGNIKTNSLTPSRRHSISAGAKALFQGPLTLNYRYDSQSLNYSSRLSEAALLVFSSLSWLGNIKDYFSLALVHMSRIRGIGDM